METIRIKHNNHECPVVKTLIAHMEKTLDSKPQDKLEIEYDEKFDLTIDIDIFDEKNNLKDFYQLRYFKDLEKEEQVTFLGE